MIRKLDPGTDRGLFVDAWLWELEAPPWFREASKVFGPSTFEDWFEGSKEETRATFGIFDPDLIGLFILTLRGKGLYEVDFTCKPRCSPSAIIEAGIKFRDEVFRDLGAEEVYLWCHKKHFSLKRICGIIGFYDSGLRILKGSYRGRVIEWRQLVITRAQVEQEKAA